jgi:uncharacterized protein with GYD domain
MPLFLQEVDYEPEAWAAQIRNPEDRIQAVRPSIEKMGGKVIAAYYTFGESDLIVIVDFPDNVSAAAFAIAVSAGGACRSLRTIPLLSIEEGMESIRRAAASPYEPPA